MAAYGVRQDRGQCRTSGAGQKYIAKLSVGAGVGISLSNVVPPGYCCVSGDRKTVTKPANVVLPNVL